MKYKEVAESILEQKFAEGGNEGKIKTKGKGSKRKHACTLDGVGDSNEAGYLTNMSSAPSVTTIYSSSSIPSAHLHSALAFGFKFHLFDLVGKESLIRHQIPCVDNQKRYMLRLPPC